MNSPVVSHSFGPTHLDPEDLAHGQLNGSVLPGHELIHAGACVQVWWVPVRRCAVLAAQVEKDGHTVERESQGRCPLPPRACYTHHPSMAWVQCRTSSRRWALGTDILLGERRAQRVPRKAVSPLVSECKREASMGVQDGSWWMASGRQSRCGTARTGIQG